MAIDYLTENEVKQIIRYLTKHKIQGFSSCKIVAITIFLFYTGIRKFELLRIKRKDFDLDNNMVKITGKQGREIPFQKAVKEKINIYFSSERERLNAFNISYRDSVILMKVLIKVMMKVLKKRKSLLFIETY